MASAKRDPEGRKRAIVEATTELVIELGLSKVNHRKVAERAGVPLGATTQYFRSLDDLKAAALGALITRYDEQIGALEVDLAGRADPARAIARYLLSYLADPERARAEAAFFVANQGSPELRDLVDRWYVRQRDLLTQHLSQRAAAAVEAYSYGLCMQIARGEAVPSEDDLTWVGARLTDDTSPSPTGADQC